MAQDSSGRLVPRQLPAAVRSFTGRKRELAELSRLLDPDSASGGPGTAGATMVISAIGGTAGVGKTIPGGKCTYLEAAVP